MTRFTKTQSGKYVVNGHTYEMLIGSRAQVWHGTACKTNGGLMKKDLMQNKAGRIVSKAKHATAKKEMRLVKSGYGTKKGKFGFVKLSGKSRKMRGGVGAPMGNMPVARAAVVNNNVQGNNQNNVNHPVAAVGAVRRGGSLARAAVVNNNVQGNVNHPVAAVGAVRRGGSKKRRGGTVNLPLSPSYYDGKGVGTSGVQLQFIAGQGN